MAHGNSLIWCQQEYEVRESAADYTGRLCVIGTDLKEDELTKLFHL